MTSRSSLYKPPAVPLLYGVSHLTLNGGRRLYVTFAVLGFQQTTGDFFSSSVGKVAGYIKKKSQLNHPVKLSFLSESPLMYCRGQPGCREEFVSVAPVTSCRESSQLSRLKMSKVTCRTCSGPAGKPALKHSVN